MFKTKMVEKCPVSTKSRGVMTLPPALITEIAGAVRDSIEWIALLNGTRSADGYEVTVEKFTIPQQYRTAGDAEMVDTQVGEGVVGVIHSHHKMGAFFSGIDTSTLNPRFPTSIVVAQARNNLGFAYKAVGKVVLPCNAVGEVEFRLAVEGVERFAFEPVKADHSGEVGDLGDCDSYSVEDTSEWTQVERAACGLHAVVDKPLMFGQDGAGFLEVVRSQTLSRPAVQGKWNYHTQGEADLRTFDVGGGTFMVTECAECRNGEKVLCRKHGFLEQYLCRDCWDGNVEVLLRCMEQEEEEKGGAGIITGPLGQESWVGGDEFTGTGGEVPARWKIS